KLGIPSSQAQAALRLALASSRTRQRAAAAFVLSRWDPQNFQSRALLNDDNVEVRFRAAEGFLAAGEKCAVPAFLALLAEESGELGIKAEMDLIRLAGAKAPFHESATNAKIRRQRVPAWS